MRYTNTNDERESYSKRSRNSFSTGQGNAAKRLFLLMIIMMCLAFAGAQSAPTVQASAAQCPLVCGPPEFDPITGECFVTCCPPDPAAKCACERQVCK